jgi:signal transduction histidine kinase
MKQTCLFLTTLLVGILFLTAAPAQTAISVEADKSIQDITPLIQTSQATRAISDVDEITFQDFTQSELSFPYSPRNLWIRVKLKNETAEPLQRLLIIESPLAGKLTLTKNGDLKSAQKSGPGYPLDQRSSPTRLGSFEINLNPGEEATYVLQRDSHHALHARVALAAPLAAEKNEGQAKTVFFFYIGAILSLVIYNFIFGIFTNQKDHLSYSVFAACFAFTAMALHGVFDTYLLPNSHFVFSNYLMFGSALTLFSASIFVGRFLNITRDFPVGYWGLRIVGVLALPCLAASLFAPDLNEVLFIFGYWIDFAIAGAIIFFIYCGLHSLLKHKNVLATYFLLSWVVIFLGTIVYIASVHGLVDSSPFTQYSLLFANLGEMLVLSLGLAYKIRVLDQEKKAALIAAEEKDRYHRLVKVLSHDVANGVSGLTFHTEMLRDLCKVPELSIHIERIFTSTTKLDKMLKSVRQEEVFYSFKSHHQLQLVNVKQACLEAINQYKFELEEKKLLVHDDLPDGKFVRADRSALINQVLSNLLSNSIKFSSVNRCIYFSFAERNCDLVLTIRDEGTGIHPEDLPHMFLGKKIISHKGTANEQGSGLGSSLISEYMKMFGGKIEVDSVHHSRNRQSGTTVRLVFPRVT